MTIKEIPGDLFTATDTTFMQCISADIACGAGIAVAFNQHFDVNCSRLKTRAFEVLQNEHCLRSLVIKFPPDKSGNPYSYRRVHSASSV